MLYLIGLGLHDEKDISVKGLNILRECDEIYVELYTSPFSGEIKNLENKINKKITPLHRQDLEENMETFLTSDKEKKVALLVPGDPLVATTHLSVILKAEEMGTKTQVVHASSVYSAVGETGLQIYKFGKTSTIPFPEKNHLPSSPYRVLKENLNLGLHTLFLLDVKAEKKRFMSLTQGIEILLQIAHKEKGKKFFTRETPCLGAARLGSPNKKIKFGKAKQLLKTDFGKPPHILIVPGKLHFLEEEALERFR